MSSEPGGDSTGRCAKGGVKGGALATKGDADVGEAAALKVGEVVVVVALLLKLSGWYGFEG